MKIVSFGGLGLNDSNYTSSLSQSFQQPGREITFTHRVGRHPTATAINYTPFALSPLEVTIEAPDVDSYRRALLAAFDTRSEARALVVANDDGSNERYIMCICRQSDQKVGMAGRGFVFSLVAAGEQSWRPVNQTVDIWEAAASGETHNISVAGDLEVHPEYRITVNAAKAGDTLVKKRFAAVRWLGVATEGFPIDVANGDWNTAALVSAGTINNPSNIAVFVDGVEVRRWIAGYNTATTKVWVNLDFDSAVTGAFSGYDGTEEATLLSATMPDGIILRNSIEQWPDRGALIIGDEIITYDGRDLGRRTLLGVARAQYESTAATHTPGTAVALLQHEIFVCYGIGTTNKTEYTEDKRPTPLSGYYSYDERKPLIDLVQSTNGQWVWDEFRDYRYPRTAGWTPVITALSQYIYTGPVAGTDSLPADTMGLGVTEPQYSGPCRWIRPLPCGLESLSVTGEGALTYTGGSAAYWNLHLVELRGNAQRTLLALEKPSISGGGSVEFGDRPVFSRTYNQTHNLASPVKPGGVLAFANDSWGLVEGHLDTVSITHQAIEGVQGPAVTLYGESTMYDANIRLENTTTGEYITIRLPMVIGGTLAIDTDNYTVTYDRGQANQFQAVRKNAGRQSFLRLIPGTNTMRIVETGMTDVIVETRYRELYRT